MDPFSQQFAGNMARTGGVQAQLQMGQDQMQAQQFMQDMAMQQQQMEMQQAAQQQEQMFRQQQAEQQQMEFAAQQQLEQQKMAQQDEYYNYLGQVQQSQLGKQNFEMQQAQQEAQARGAGGAALMDFWLNGNDPEKRRFAQYYAENGLPPDGFASAADSSGLSQKGGNLPTSIQEYEYGMRLPEGQRESFFSSMGGGSSGGQPLSDVAKINADLQAGRITQEQADSALGKRLDIQPTAEQDTSRKLAEESITNIETAMKELYGEGGKINRNAIPLFRQAAFGDSRTFTQAMERAIQNSVYLKTGKGANKSELEILLNQYMPNVIDNDEQIANKMSSFQQYINSNIPSSKSSGGSAAVSGAGGGNEGWGIVQ